MSRMDTGYTNLRLGIARLNYNSVIELSIFILNLPIVKVKFVIKIVKTFFG